MSRTAVAALAAGFFLLAARGAPAQEIAVGSKRFTEGYVVGEIARKALENAGFSVEHKRGLGNTAIVWEALRGGSIAAYCEYTGTILEVILKTERAMTAGEIRAALAADGVGMSAELGFENTYAIVVDRTLAEARGLRTISDLRNHADLRVGATHEFLDRQDGWPAMAARYGLPLRDVRGIDHALGYAAIAHGEIDVKDTYTTDAKLLELDLVVLEDDLGFFPEYQAVFLYRLDADRRAIEVLESLAGTFDETLMIRLNAEAERTKNYAAAAALYFRERDGTDEAVAGESLASKIARWTARHLMLVAVSMALAIAVGIPLGLRASRPGTISQLILGVTGMIQTVPSLALLALLVPVPWLGIRPTTAIVALFLYSLLPIVRNTATGLQNIPAPLRESAAALGLEPSARLIKVYLPLASRTLLAGIKTSAIINVGTATVAALIGAGGLGEPILSGLALNDSRTILQGAIPAALLAILVQIGFSGVDRLLIPRGLRLEETKDRGRPLGSRRSQPLRPPSRPARKRK